MSTVLQYDSPTASAVAPTEIKPNLGAVEHSTRSFLGLIRDWKARTISVGSALSEPARETQKQVANYVVAYSDALKSAESGYTAAEEGLTLTNQKDWAKISQAECDDYIAGMVAISKTGEERSKKALAGFRHVRVGINEALTRIDQGNLGMHEAAGQANEYIVLQTNLSVLGDFENLMKWYISWWTQTSMEESYQANRIQGMAKKTTKLGVDAAVRKWTSLKESYMDYTLKMQRVQDDYPDVFELSSEKKTLSGDFTSSSPRIEFEGRPQISELQSDVTIAIKPPSVEEKAEARGPGETDLSTDRASHGDIFIPHKIDPDNEARFVKADDPMVKRQWWQRCLCQ
ncbi:hypothetical protein CVT25_005414 [Psilocybe cyanescens]|uniref:Uncharacterized protein n=1 Tax=Psilocybe cyanescens TaxID=93625 RepID=A0A409WXE7_PSICY|nr:hypothetical protein CVT25_005414 [Psilocybe cyanescens]